MPMGKACEKAIRKTTCHIHRASTWNLCSPNATYPSSLDHRSGMVTQPCSAHPQKGAFTHLHVSKGLYKPAVSKLSMPGYTIRFVPSPRQLYSLHNRQHCPPPYLPNDRRCLTETIYSRHWCLGEDWQIALACANSVERRLRMSVNV